MSRDQGLFFESPRGQNIPVGTFVKGHLRSGGANVQKIGTLAYRNGVFCIQPFTDGGTPIPISETPGHVHPGTVVLY